MKITSKECMSWVYAKYRFELNCIVWWIQFDNGVALHHQSFACSDQTVEVFQLKHVKRRKISQKIRFSLSLPFYHLWYVVRFIQKIPVFFSSIFNRTLLIFHFQRIHGGCCALWCRRARATFLSRISLHQPIQSKPLDSGTVRLMSIFICVRDVCVRCIAVKNEKKKGNWETK